MTTEILSHSLKNLTTETLESLIIQSRQRSQKGQLCPYIPYLKEQNPEQFALCISSLEGEIYQQGENLFFPLMSVIKPFTLLYLLVHLGAEVVFTKVGKEASQQKFNSLDELQSDLQGQGIPRNPMINSGAITLAALLLGKDGRSRCENLRLWLNEQGNCQLFLQEKVLNSVEKNIRKNGSVNQKIATQLAAQGCLENPELALDTYNHICCLGGTVTDLAHLGILLVNSPSSLLNQACQQVQDLMTTCGLYEDSESFSQGLGICLPTKSGVSGAILSLVPNQGAIACYSPPLDLAGNSIAGLFLIEKIAFFLQGKLI